jgi:hypothetical protein
LQWDSDKNYKSLKIANPSKSGLLFAMGSGSKDFNSIYNNMLYKNISYGIYHCFIKTLESGLDINCGGAPQLVALYRKPNSCGKSFGIIYDKKRYYNGLEVKRKMEPAPNP